jgi:type IV pilus assembly protein PilX
MTMSQPAATGNQRGAVLVIGLIILVVMTILGITAMQSTVVEEKMAGNFKDKDVAFRAAEAGLQEGLSYLESQAEPPRADASGSQNVWPGCTVQDGDTCVGRGSISLLETSGQAVDYDAAAWGAAGSAPLTGVAAQPRIAIEHRYVPPLDVEAAAQGRGVHFYTVSALGYGASARTKVLLQSTVAKVYGW